MNVVLNNTFFNWQCFLKIFKLYNNGQTGKIFRNIMAISSWQYYFQNGILRFSQRYTENELWQLCLYKKENIQVHHSVDMFSAHRESCKGAIINDLNVRWFFWNYQCFLNIVNKKRRNATKTRFSTIQPSIYVTEVRNERWQWWKTDVFILVALVACTKFSVNRPKQTKVIEQKLNFYF